LKAIWNQLLWLLLVSLACLALAVRLPQSGARPMHTDEAVNAYITGRLLTGGAYHYDPRDRHGPTLYAVALPLARVAGAKNLATLKETTLRLGPILTGSLAVLLFALLAPDLGLVAALFAALCWTLAPLPVYYSRDFIHETLFVTATLGLLAYGWRWLKTGSVASGMMTGGWAGLMLATKETAVLNFAAAALAGGWWLIRHRHRSSDAIPRLFAMSGGFIDKNVTWQRPEKASGTLGARWLGFALDGLLLLGMLAVFYSWGGKNWTGLADLLRALPRFLIRASGEGHEKPWWYYLRLLGGGWSGWVLLLLAAAGAFRAVRSRTAGALICWLIYAVAIIIIYSAIPYKTPWLALNLFLPLAVLAGAGAVTAWELTETLGHRRWFAAGLVGLILLLALDTRQWVFRRPADEKNPYAYAHTGEDLLRLPQRLGRLAGPQSTFAVVAADPWPLPWYLRNFPRVGYWQPGRDPGPADFYLTSPEAAGALKPRLAQWRPEYFGVRPGVLLILWTPPPPPAPRPAPRASP
jgi:uncharacterized protein (TIGR03663 family)